MGLEFPDAGASLRSFSEALPQAKLVDVADAAMYIRRVKSPEEIEIVRQGSRIAELGAYAAIKALREGVPEYEVVLAATNTMVREIAATFPHIDIRDGEFRLPSFSIFRLRATFIIGSAPPGLLQQIIIILTTVSLYLAPPSQFSSGLLISLPAPSICKVNAPPSISGINSAKCCFKY